MVCLDSLVPMRNAKSIEGERDALCAIITVVILPVTFPRRGEQWLWKYFCFLVDGIRLGPSVCVWRWDPTDAELSACKQRRTLSFTGTSLS